MFAICSFLGFFCIYNIPYETLGLELDEINKEVVENNLHIAHNINNPEKYSENHF